MVISRSPILDYAQAKSSMRSSSSVRTMWKIPTIRSLCKRWNLAFLWRI
ncbi:hypothetical protein MGSAQ_000644 [marine sediment metagenome]|uniref:Uncharacterized protein n=1 Tax=marine sediment metagenome TaxID=412755 RepID=A0A1B6NWR3_9ZZZZ